METKEKNRKNYKKPQVHKVKLEIDEAVLLGCKATTLTTALGTRYCGHGTCKSLGS